MMRVLHTLVLAVLGATLVIMCFHTWRTAWMTGEEGVSFYTYHRWFATPIGFFDVVAPTAMLATVLLTIMVASGARRAATSWVQIGAGAVTALFVTIFGYNSSMSAGTVHGLGVLVAPLLGSVTVLLLVLRLLTSKRNSPSKGTGG